LRRISKVSDEYSRGRLHITTRQDIQIHYVDLDRTPELWAELERDNVTLREACGNTVRNVTASETTGFDLDEAFDVSPYADAVFKFFLRNPICQEMGRKFKVSFSSSDEDTGLSYIHDLGFIAKIENNIRGFKIMLGGGLGSQPRHADVLYSFLPTDKIIPLMEAVLRVFDRHGERKSRSKARMKFLLKSIGLEAFKELIETEQKAIEHQSVPINHEAFPISKPVEIETPKVEIKDHKTFELWKSTNLIPQKQEGYKAIGIKVLLGDFYTNKARVLADLVDTYAAGELRLTLRQNIVIPFVREDLIPVVYLELEKLGFTELGYNKAVDITACPGTDTCNLGISSSTGIARELETVIKTEYKQYLNSKDLVIKISGCMNACGQHNMANIGFQGMSIKTKNNLVAPALQVLLGGGNSGNGSGRFADKVIKVPSKRGPQALRLILDDFQQNSDQKTFYDYYSLKGEKYFYSLLKPLSDSTNLTADDYVDWGSKQPYKKAIGIGECAGVVIDLISTLFLESDEKIMSARSDFENKAYNNAIYFAYSSMVNSAKALLLSKDHSTNTQASIINQFDEVFVSTNLISLGSTFAELIYQINKNEPSASFAENYIQSANEFLTIVKKFRKNDLNT
jgi:sulfite reductase (ferredoxin)